MKIYNLYKFNKNNIGDIKSPSLKYFTLNENVVFDDICKVKQLNFKNTKAIIVGGGGLTYFNDSMQYICSNYGKKLIGWGIGVNNHKEKLITFPNYFDKFKLLGVRDYNTKYNWVPCASCMDNFFDNSKKHIVDEIGIVEHIDVPININLPKIKNNVSFENIINFINKFDTIISNSYHGVYWSTLLNKKVICIPFSNRFYGFKHKPTIIYDINQWKNTKTQRYPEALQECREANIKFYNCVVDFLSKSSKILMSFFSIVFSLISLYL